MTPVFRIVLILVSLGTFGIVIQKIRHSRMQIEDAVFWVLLCIMFILFAIFPAVPDFLAKSLGIYSTPNFLFLFMIFILVLKIFSLSMHISALEGRLRKFVQEEALSELKAREAADPAYSGGAGKREEGPEKEQALSRKESTEQSETEEGEKRKNG